MRRKSQGDGLGEPRTTYLQEFLEESQENVNTVKLIRRNSNFDVDKRKSPLNKKKRSNLKTWLIRGIFGIMLFSYFFFAIHYGPVLIIFNTIGIQVICFQETINVAYKLHPKLPWFKRLSWYFLLIFNYFFLGEIVMKYFGAYVNYYIWLRIIVAFHRFISFCLYFVGVVWFVLTLSVKYDREQYGLLAWTHVTMLVFSAQSYMVVRNLFQGLIWLIVPITTVAVNDIAAYICGTVFGRTPLIKLSPNKTWEGFLGSLFFTILYGYFVSSMLCSYNYLICPIEYKLVDSGVNMSSGNCDPSPLFHWSSSRFSVDLFNVVKFTQEFSYYPFVVHSFFISLFISLVSPFGGFFASGFKRAFKIKDFGNAIPGHGGVIDRFDCQFLTLTFVNVYISSFIKSHSVERILEKVFYMNEQNQVQLLHMMEGNLKVSGNLS